MSTIAKITPAGLIAAAPLVAIAGAAGASASPDDDSTFLELIVHPAAGLAPLRYDNASVAVSQGRAACTLLDEGYSPAATINAVDSVLPVNREGAITLVASAVVVFCPWHMPSSAA